MASEATSTKPKFPLRNFSIELVRLTKEDLIAAGCYPTRNISSCSIQPKWHDLYFREMKTLESYVENKSWLTLRATNMGGLNKIFSNLTGPEIASEICSIKIGERTVYVFLKRLPYSQVSKYIDKPIYKPKYKSCIKPPLWYDLYFSEMLRYEKRKKEVLNKQKMEKGELVEQKM